MLHFNEHFALFWMELISLWLEFYMVIYLLYEKMMVKIFMPSLNLMVTAAMMLVMQKWYQKRCKSADVKVNISEQLLAKAKKWRKHNIHWFIMLHIPLTKLHFSCLIYQVHTKSYWQIVIIFCHFVYILLSHFSNVVLHFHSSHDGFHTVYCLHGNCLWEGLPLDINHMRQDIKIYKIAWRMYHYYVI